MAFKESFSGFAKTIISPFKDGPDGSPLNPDRRKIILGGAALGALTIAAACSREKAFPSYTPSPRGIEKSLDNQKEISWRNLSPQERIYKLETKEYPAFQNFSPARELVITTAEEFQTYTRSPKTASQLSQVVAFADTPTIIKSREEEEGRLSEDEKDKTKIALQVRTKGAFTVNTEVLERVLQEKQKTVRKLVDPKGKEHDLKTVLIRNLLRKAYAMDQLSMEKVLSRFKLSIPGKTNTIQVEGVLGFIPLGFENGKEYLPEGAREAMADYIANIPVLRKNEVNISLDAYLNLASGIIFRLNDDAKLSDEEFTEYAFGTKKMEDLFYKWTSSKGAFPDKNKGIAILAVIAEVRTGSMNLTVASNIIDNLLKPASPAPPVIS